MIDLVPSKQVSEYLDEIGHVFTDSERATLIYDAKDKRCCSHAECLMALEDIAMTTEDAKLKQQIEERIKQEKEKLARLKDNSYGEIMYEVMDEDGNVCGDFPSFEAAIKLAKSQGNICCITKKILIKGENNPPMSNYEQFICLPLIQLPDDDAVEKPLWLMAVSADLDKNGEILRIWCNEKLNYVIPQPFNQRFESRFINIPFPETFRRGIPVKLVRSGKYGIISQGSEMWEDFIEKYGDDKDISYLDMVITVVILGEDGKWYRHRINPIYLEVGMPSIKDAPELSRAIEALSDYWSGSGSEEIVLKYAREYAREYVDVNGKFGTAYTATCVKDLITG